MKPIATTFTACAIVGITGCSIVKAVKQYDSLLAQAEQVRKTLLLSKNLSVGDIIHLNDSAESYAQLLKGLSLKNYKSRMEIAERFWEADKAYIAESFANRGQEVPKEFLKFRDSVESRWGKIKQSAEAAEETLTTLRSIFRAIKTAITLVKWVA